MTSAIEKFKEREGEKLLGECEKPFYWEDEYKCVKKEFAELLERNESPKEMTGTGTTCTSLIASAELKKIRTLASWALNVAKPALERIAERTEYDVDEPTHFKEIIAKEAIEKFPVNK